MSFLLSLGSLFALVVFIAGGSGCARYRSVLNEDPALIGIGDQDRLLAIPPPAAWKDIKKVVVIILENADIDSALSQPNFSKIAKKGALLSNYFGITHPSQPNYIALLSGSTQGVTSNDSVDLPMRHLGDLLEENNKTWRTYGEDYPGKCFQGESSGNYVRKHMPFISFENIQKNRKRCRQVVSAETFASDLIHSSLADFSLYIPNQLNNGHDTGVEYADSWLGEKMFTLLETKNPDKDTLFVVTFDEGSIFGDNKIYTVLFGAGVRVGATSMRPYSHFSLLKTIEMIFGVPSLGLNDAKANFIGDVWKTN